MQKKPIRKNCERECFDPSLQSDAKLWTRLLLDESLAANGGGEIVPRSLRHAAGSGPIWHKSRATPPGIKNIFPFSGI